MKWSLTNIGIEPSELPVWLANASCQSINEGVIPIQEILDGSLYYPSCGGDGGPIKHLGSWFHSFVYVDYGYTRDDLLNELENKPFIGYQILGQRSISLSELTPNGWPQPELTVEERIIAEECKEYQSPLKFCEWLVFERRAALSNGHGPFRFSMLYLSVDGIQAFNALYVAKKIKPKAIAVIQSGYGFGLNWIDFRDEKSALARIVLSNPAGAPDCFIFGGRGKREFLKNTWSPYRKNIGWYDYHSRGNVGVWKA
jgi:hypothetical protein